jgi:hypothetical protein
VARVMVLVDDLMLASRVTTALDAGGHQVRRESSVPGELDGTDLVVADLDAIDPELLESLDVPVLAFYRHTDTETRARAEDAGLDIVVPRSRMVRELPELVERLLSA